MAQRGVVISTHAEVEVQTTMYGAIRSIIHRTGITAVNLESIVLKRVIGVTSEEARKNFKEGPWNPQDALSLAEIGEAPITNHLNCWMAIFHGDHDTGIFFKFNGA